MTSTEPDSTDTTTLDPAPINLTDPELLGDPFGGFSRLRERTRIIRGSAPGLAPLWVVTRYEDVKLVLGDARFVMDPTNVPGSDTPDLVDQLHQARGIPNEYRQYLRAGLTDLDGAEHLRLRKLVSRAFTVRRVAQLRPRIEQLAEQLLDQLPAKAENGVVDLLEHFAYPLPIAVICELVGIPEPERDRWREWSVAMTAPTGAGLVEAMEGMIASTRRVIQARQADPADDLISGLIQAREEDGDRLSEVEMITLILTIVVAGHETTAHLIGNGTAALLTHPDQLALLRGNPELMPRAVHELLRWCGPAVMTRMRYAVEDIEIGGHLVRRGEAVLPALPGANYDPRRFADPDRLDLARDPDGHRETHVAFAHGMHYCLGAALARQEGEVAFEALLRRFPDLALGVDPTELDREPNPGAWRLTALPVRL